MKAFVTGSTGLLGSTLVQQLVDEGHEVLALARSAEKAERILGNTGAHVIIGDMLDIPAFAPQLVGCDVLFHAAAYFKEYTGADTNAEEMLQKINVDGTIALLNEAKAHGVHNVVYVSSSGVIGKMDGQASDESASFNNGTANRYFQSKIRAEEAITAWLADNPNMRVVMILPSAIVGPNDNGPTGFGGMIIEILKEDLPAVPPGGITTIDVRDVATAMIRAVDYGQSGERFIVANEFIKLSDLSTMIGELGGVKAPSFNMPYPMAWTFGAVSELVSKITGKPPLATRVIMKTLNEATQVSGGKTGHILNVDYRPLTESIEDAITWFRANGYA